MATLDVTGRTLKESTGKARVVQPYHNRLVASDLGYVPDSEHRGLPEDKKTHRHLSPNRSAAGSVHLGINSMAPKEAPQGRRHVDVVHHNLSDDSKRQAGRIGLKKVIPPHQCVAPLSVGERPRPASASGNRIRLYSAEQQARIRLQQLAEARQDLRPAITTALNEKAAEQVVELEKRIHKQLLFEEARRAEKQRNPQVEGRARSPDLGRTSLSGVVPFAVDGATAPRPHSARLTCRKTYTVQTNLEKEKHLAETEGPSPSRARFSKKFSEIPSQPREAPFDTTIASETYPEPPLVGVADHVPHGKSHITYQPETKNIDEEQRKKAAARCRFASSSQSFTIFEAEARSTVAEPKRQSLRQSVESQFKAREDASMGVKKGKLISEQKYRPTSLW